MASPVTVVVLAAGEGTRMRSPSRPKVLFDFAGRSLLGHVLAAVRPLAPESVAVVVGHAREQVVAHLADTAPEATPVVQEEQRGTGHAVGVALEALPATAATVLVVPGDTPLLTPDTLTALVEAHGGAAATLVTSLVADPAGYGRVVRSGDGAVARVVEHKDAGPEELAIDEVATGVYAFDAAFLADAVRRLGTANAQGEQYLPDVVGIAVEEGRTVRALTAPPAETAGINDRVQLAAAGRAYNARLLEAHMRAGVTVVDPATTWVDADVSIGVDATLLPGTFLHGRTSVGPDATVGPDVTLTDTGVGARTTVTRTVASGAVVGADCSIGPFAFLRPGTRLADGVKIGTYVEVKASDIGAGSKVPHLSYVGDATIGEGTNIGAASVFVNYDGVAKHQSTIGDHARTGADNMFVAPVSVGDGAYTAAGSVIVEDVPPGAMAVARGQAAHHPRLGRAPPPRHRRRGSRRSRGAAGAAHAAEAVDAATADAAADHPEPADPPESPA